MSLKSMQLYEFSSGLKETTGFSSRMGDQLVDSFLGTLDFPIRLNLIGAGNFFGKSLLISTVFFVCEHKRMRIGRSLGS